MRIYLERNHLFSEIDERYGLERYLACVCAGGSIPARRDRCYQCYRLRLDNIAKRCAEMELEGFSTTLLASREQSLEVVRAAGRDAATAFGIEFVDGDYRHFEPDDKELKGVYKQQYCGCIFSEEERYRGTAKHLYFPKTGENGVTPFPEG